jgi:hypothetical protein
MNTLNTPNFLHNETEQSVLGLKVFVYFNLHKKVFSVKAMEGPNKGRVIAHTAAIKLNNATFKVSEAGRQRVLKERKKNVHAGVVGYIEGFTQGEALSHDQIKAQGYTGAYYNPYKTATFLNGSQPLNTADNVTLYNKAIYFKNN